MTADLNWRGNVLYFMREREERRNQREFTECIKVIWLFGVEKLLVFNQKHDSIGTIVPHEIMYKSLILVKFCLGWQFPHPGQPNETNRYLK